MIGSHDDEVLEEWYYVLSDGHGKYLDFMGDKDGQPGHNRRMLTYLAGIKDPRERELIIQAWQFHDHMCNTGRAESANRAWRLGLAIAFVLPAFYYFGLFLDTEKAVHLAGFILYSIAALVIIFGIGRYYKYLENRRDLGSSIESGENGAGVCRRNLDKVTESNGDLRQLLQDRFGLEDKREFAETIWRIAEFLVIFGIAVVALGVDASNQKTVDWGFWFVVSGTVVFAFTVVYNLWTSRQSLKKLASVVHVRFGKK